MKPPPVNHCARGWSAPPIDRRRLMMAGGSLAMGWLAGCATLPPADLVPPTLAFQQFELESLSLSQVVFSLTLAAGNPNDIDLPINDLDFELRLAGSTFGQGRARDRAIRLPARGQVPVQVRFEVPLARFIRLLRELPRLPLEQLGYELNGQARWGESGVVLPFSRRDSLESLRELSELLQAFGRPAPATRER
ncbi:MAG: LEA type 2 family protein [Burkholderiaceae bacterium]